MWRLTSGHRRPRRVWQTEERALAAEARVAEADERAFDCGIAGCRGRGAVFECRERRSRPGRRAGSGRRTAHQGSGRTCGGSRGACCTGRRAGGHGETRVAQAEERATTAQARVAEADERALAAQAGIAQAEERASAAEARIAEGRGTGDRCGGASRRSRRERVDSASARLPR